MSQSAMELVANNRMLQQYAPLLHVYVSVRSLITYTVELVFIFLVLNAGAGVDVVQSLLDR